MVTPFRTMGIAASECSWRYRRIAVSWVWSTTLRFFPCDPLGSFRLQLLKTPRLALNDQFVFALAHMSLAELYVSHFLVRWPIELEDSVLDFECSYTREQVLAGRFLLGALCIFCRKRNPLHPQ